MKNDMWKKGLVIGIILLFVGVNVLPSTSAIKIEFNKEEQPLQTQKKILFTSAVTSWPFFGIFLTYIYGVGETSSSLQTDRRFWINLPFEFINEEAYVKIRWPLFSPFPWKEWNLTGLGEYNAFLFFGGVKELNNNNSYRIEGYCLRLEFPK